MSALTDNRKKIFDCNTCYMLGMLAESEVFYSHAGDEQLPITTWKNSDNGIIIFHLKPLSQDPQIIAEIVDPIMKNPFYIGKDADQNNTICSIDYKDAQYEQRKEILMDKLKGKLILFRPKMIFSSMGDKVHKNVEIINIEGIDANAEMSFIPIPIVNMNTNDFEKRLWEAANILLEDYNHSMYQPEFILCNNYLYFDFPDWTKHSTNNKMWSCENASSKINKIKFDINSDDMSDNIIKATDNLFFIDNILVNRITKIDGAERENLNESINSNEAPPNSSEQYFIKGFSDYLLNENLYYPINDLINLHTCIKTNPITILAGMSGTGKTKLATFYTKMLDLSEENKNFLFLPISPSFTEPSDLLGYLNNTNGLFVPSETGLTDFLMHSNEDKTDSMHIVIFDEMNLSQVEYWFAPFISLLEREKEKRRLTLYSPNAHCINKRDYSDTILLGDNLRFIGTVNIDETTKDFSDRLLDRANVIVLNKATLKDLKDAIDNRNIKNQSYKQFMCTTTTAYNSWINNEQWYTAYNELELEFLDELHLLINKYDKQKGFSFRIAKKIGEYLNNIPKDENNEYMLSREEAFDLQLRQRLVTKIKGTDKQYGKLIGVIKDNNSLLPIDSDLFNFLSLEKYNSISHFNTTKEEIIKKAKELGIYGYAN